MMRSVRAFTRSCVYLRMASAGRRDSVFNDFTFLGSATFNFMQKKLSLDQGRLTSKDGEVVFWGNVWRAAQTPTVQWCIFIRMLTKL